jgi:hypothetical protein
MSDDMLGERDSASVSGVEIGDTGKRYQDNLICFRDVEEAEAVCGDCGRPVCGPILPLTVRGLVSSLFNDYGHGRRFHDYTFHEYRHGLGRIIFAGVMIGIVLLFSVVFSNIIPALWSIISQSSTGLDSAVPQFLSGFNSAVVQSAVILGVAGIFTLRYQRGERITSFRLRVRKTFDRVVCDDCSENRLVQILLTYAVTAIFMIIILIGIRGIITTESAGPLRLVAVGIGFRILRGDIVAYILEALGTSAPEVKTTPSEGLGTDIDNYGVRTEDKPDSRAGDVQKAED